MSVPNEAVEPRIYERLAIFLPSVHLWSGTVANQEADFQMGKNGKMPPKRVTSSLGAKYVVDPERLHVFQTLKKRLYRYLELKAVQFQVGFAVPPENIDDVSRQLDEIKAKFYEEKGKFLSDYPTLPTLWATENAAASKSILVSAPPVGYVDSHLQMDYSVVKVMPWSDNDEEQTKTKQDVAANLFREIEKSASKLYHTSLRNREEVTMRVVNPLIQMIEKLEMFSFVDARAMPLALEARQCLAGLSKSGPYRGRDLENICSCCLKLSAEVDLANEAKIAEKLSEEAGFVLMADEEKEEEIVASTTDRKDPEPVPVEKDPHDDSLDIDEYLARLTAKEVSHQNLSDSEACAEESDDDDYVPLF